MAQSSFATELEPAVTRAVGYSLLAHCFAYPDPAKVRMLNEAAAAGAPFLDRTPLAILLEPALNATSELLRPAYADVFTLTASPDCPNYETAFIDTEMISQAHRMARLKGFYRLFGIEYPAEGIRPVDISVELDFVGFLVRKELYAAEHLGAPRVGQSRRAQRLFLSEHLGCWAPALGRRVVEKAEGNAFYLRLGTALEDWVTADCERLNAVPQQQVDGPNVPMAMPASHGPEFASAPQIIGMDQISEVN